MKKGYFRLLSLVLGLVLLLGCFGSTALADVWADDYFGSRVFEVGFGFPYSNSSGWTTDYYTNNGYIVESINRNRGAAIYGKLLRVGNNNYSAMITTPEQAKELLEALHKKYAECEYVDILGLPALIDYYTTKDGFYASELWYIRYSVAVQLVCVSLHSPITSEDMKKLAESIEFEEADAVFLPADTVLSVSSKNDPVTVTAGKNIPFTAAFANPSRVCKKYKNDDVVWSVGRADNGEAVEGVTIDAKGLLKVDKKLDAPVDLQVKVSSDLFGTSATYSITAMPIVTKVILDTAELFFYTGTEEPQTVKASLEPATVPPIGLTWTPGKKNVVGIEPVEDGTVSVTPLNAGKTDIVVKEPGGKSAKLTVNVVPPVESVELAVNGKPKAGVRVNMTATLMPRNAGNKTVQWSLDVGEEIATISEKGQLTLGKEVASGTKITVTCTALGAPNPVIGTTVIEIP